MSELKDNKWISRKDMVKGLLDLVRPLKEYYSPEKSKLKVGSTAAHYGESPALMEGYARVLWGLGPLFATDNSDLDQSMRNEIDTWKELYLEGLINGTDPANKGYWQDMADYDQKMVETAALCVALGISKNALWDPLTKAQKKQVEAWMRQINQHKVHANNWRFFRILTNMTFARLHLKIDEKSLVDDFEVVENCYMSDGWYYDGHDGQIDYYIPFAMHFYGLIFACLAPDLTEKEAGSVAKFFSAEYKNILLSRGKKFAEQYSLWFTDEGKEVPFGRSLTYRFAHAAFFSALIFAMESMGDSGSIGRYKHLLLGNLRSWFKYPITDNKGILSIGYCYPNLIMSEKYNAPGSPYWSFKVFLVLALSAESRMWKAVEEKHVPAERSYLKAPHMIICHDRFGDKDHVTMFPCGQHAGMDHGNCDSKYKKLVYSGTFGFSVQRGTSLDDGAFDNVFVVSRKGENIYRMTNCVKWEASRDEVHMVSNPIDGVMVDTRVIPAGNGWHIRIHNISTGIAIDTADGGFALRIDEVSMAYNVVEKEGARYLSAAGSSIGVCTGDSQSEVSFDRVFPCTNLMAPLTVIPYVKRTYAPGNYIQINAFYGAPVKDLIAPPKLKYFV